MLVKRHVLFSALCLFIFIFALLLLYSDYSLLSHTSVFRTGVEYSGHVCAISSWKSSINSKLAFILVLGMASCSLCSHVLLGARLIFVPVVMQNFIFCFGFFSVNVGHSSFTCWIISFCLSFSCNFGSTSAVITVTSVSSSFLVYIASCGYHYECYTQSLNSWHCVTQVGFSFVVKLLHYILSIVHLMHISVI